jgi:antibiotic biosynthesis monooxygenase (ABM) superfamily enzyme
MDTTAAPVKIVLELRAPAAETPALEDWIRKLIATADRTGTLQGSSVLVADRGRHLVLLRFASRADHEQWQTSADVAELMHDGHAYVVDERPAAKTGLETWFAVAGNDTPVRVPPKWKMALVTWCALLPQVVALSFVVPKSLPFPLGPAISTAIPVCALTWIVMPRVTRLLERWLYPR